MFTYTNLENKLHNFVNLKINYISLLKQCEQYNYDLNNSTHKTYKIWLDKELKTEIFKIKYYKLYLSQLTEVFINYLKNINYNIDNLNDFVIDDDNKQDILNIDELINHKSLYKRVKLILKDYGLSFDKKEIISLQNNIDKCNNIISLFTNNNILNNNLDISKIEAIPKNLAEKGDRPNDNNPIGQQIYDLQLLHGFGEKTASKFVNKSITLEKLLNEWNKFIHSNGNDDTLMIDRLPNDPTLNMNNWTKHKIMNSKFKYLQSRMIAENCLSLVECNHEQLIGIKYFYDICEKIPRNEITKMEKFIKIVVKYINPDFIIGCCGSYRRGRDRSGDIDCLLTHPKLKTQEDINNFQNVNGNILLMIVNLLTQKGFLTDHLTEGGNTKYMGICKLPNKPEYKLYRRIDIRFVPYNSYGTALLYFTGSKNFNTQMRNKALKMGYTLSEYGLFHYIYDNKTNKKIKGEQLPTPNEEDVFKILDMEYKTPKERDI